MAVPVLYYHSVGDHPDPRPWSFLTIPTAVFEAQVSWLASNGYYFADLTELHEHVTGRRTLPERSVVLTFDDGFLDNWVVATPVAERYGARFTVFVNPDFVDRDAGVRPTLADVGEGRLQEEDVQWWGYLSWEEIQRMQEGGLVDIQSHAMTHTWYPVSDRIVDYHHPGDDYYWLYWNRHPDRKPRWLSEYHDEIVPLGTPVFEHRKSLQAKAYHPPPGVAATLVAHVADHGGAEFFQRGDWRSELDAVVRELPSGDGASETDEERLRRIDGELAGSRRILEEKLGKPVRFLAWPGGGASPELRERAAEAGYWATTKGTVRNAEGGDASQIMRGTACLGGRVPNWTQIPFLKGQLDRLSGRRTANGLVLSGVRRLRSWLT